MSEHLHSTFIPGCFRCELGLDEVGADGHITIRAGDLRALAAAREENGGLRRAAEEMCRVDVITPGQLAREFNAAKVKLRAALAREDTDADR